MGELEHRVKNTLMVVATVIERAHDNTQSIDEFVESLKGRIQSMASTQNLLSQEHWRGVGLANLIRAELHPYATGTNTIVEGPAVSLTQTASHALAMVSWFMSRAAESTSHFHPAACAAPFSCQRRAKRWQRELRSDALRAACARRLVRVPDRVRCRLQCRPSA
jgi:hypothetical protein